MGIGSSMHRNGAWSGQLERVRRWHNRLMAAARGETYLESDLNDFAFAFFQNCLHLRDWVQQTSSIPRSDLDVLFARVEMKVCRDLANGTKHLNITRPSVDAEFSIVREYDPQARYRYRPVVFAGDERHDLLDLACRCLEAWESFLRPHSGDVREAIPPFMRGGGA